MAQPMSVLGIDIAQLVFHVVGMNHPRPVGLWGWRFREHGHERRLIVPQFVKAYGNSPQNDTRDAEAICEAVTRPTMRFVPIQQPEQQDLQTLHRIRERLASPRLPARRRGNRPTPSTR